jgi:hypothetical protein
MMRPSKSKMRPVGFTVMLFGSRLRAPGLLGLRLGPDWARSLEPGARTHAGNLTTVARSLKIGPSRSDKTKKVGI